MINGAVVVVVILQESVGVDQHCGHVIVTQQPFAFQCSDQMPCAFCNVKIVNQYVIQQFSQLCEPNLIHIGYIFA